MTTTLEFAKSIELNLHNKRKLGFHMEQACLYGVDDDGLIVLFQRHSDIYELLDNTSVADLLTVYGHIAVATTGWAAPIAKGDEPDDIAPSQHKDRRRVRLIVVADKDSMVSALRFSDSPDEVITDEGSAIGALADAIREATNKAPSVEPWDFLDGDDNDK